MLIIVGTILLSLNENSRAGGVCKTVAIGINGIERLGKKFGYDEGFTRIAIEVGQCLFIGI